jgi:D-lactate dehydrogenase (cytochrome)
VSREALISQLRAMLGDRLATGDAVRDHHSRGESHHHGVLPDAVAFPASTAEVQAIVRRARPRTAP